MIWLFALGLIVLATFHRGFRKLALWGVAISVVLFVVQFIRIVANEAGP